MTRPLATAIVTITAAVTLVSVSIFLFVASRDRIPLGTSVDGIPMGGLSPAQATVVLERHLHALAPREIRVIGTEGLVAESVTPFATLLRGPRDLMAPILSGASSPADRILLQALRLSSPLCVSAVAPEKVTAWLGRWKGHLPTAKPPFPGDLLAPLVMGQLVASASRAEPTTAVEIRLTEPLDSVVDSARSVGAP